LEQFDVEAKRYDQEVYEEYRTKFLEKANSDLFPLFQSLLKTIMNFHRNKFEKTIRDLVGNGKSLIEDFDHKTRILLKESLFEFETMIMDNLVAPFQWEFGVEKNEFCRNLDDKMEPVRNRQGELLNDYIEELIKQQILRQLAQVFEQSDKDLWDKIRTFCNDNQSQWQKEYIDKHNDILGPDAKLKDIDFIILETLVLVFKEQVKHLDLLMDRRFSKLFKLDSDSVPRRWKQGDNVKELWLESKSKVEILIDLYSIVRIRTEDSELSFFELKDGNFNYKEEMPNIPKDLIVFDVDDCIRLHEKFKERADTLFNEAIKEQESSIHHGAIPKYMLLLLCILGFNEFTWVISFFLSGPLGILLMILLSVLAYSIYAFHLWPLIKPALTPFLETLKNVIMGRIEAFFQPKKVHTD